MHQSQIDFRAPHAGAALLCSGSKMIDSESPWMRAMRRGDFEAAWRETDRTELVRREEERKGTLVFQPYHLLWNGTPFDGKRVLVRCNHGLGDTIQFIRFVPLIRAVAESVTVLVQPHLVELLRDERFGTVLNGWTDEPPPPHDVEVEIMELAYAFRSTPETLPRAVPYLPTAHLPKIEVAGERNVGLLWAASEYDTRRSIPLELLEPLRLVPGLTLYSLQQGTEEAFLPLHRQTQRIEQLAAAMLELDLIITVDCMAAHLAGALGRPTWGLLRAECDWRWMEGREDSPWYPTMRLFRQKREGDWEPAVKQLCDSL